MNIDGSNTLACTQSIGTIKALGFLLAEGSEDADSEAAGPRIIDWDELELQRSNLDDVCGEQDAAHG